MHSLRLICALAIALGALGNEPESTEEAIRRAADLARAGQVAEALALLNSWQIKDHLPAAYFALKGTLEARSTQFQAAEKDLSTALVGREDTPDVLYTLGLVCLQLNHAAQARDALLRAANLRPAKAEGWLALGEAYAKLDERSPAVASIDKAMTLGSTSAAICFGAGTAYEDVGDFGRAAHAFERIPDLDSRHDALKTRCLRDLLHAELPAEASQLAAKWREEQKLVAGQHLEIGILFAEARIYDDAAAEFQAALRMKPAMTEAKYNLALAYLFEQKYDLSAALAKEIETGNGTGQGHEILGLIKEEQGDPICARGEFEESVRANPHSANALFQLGRVELQLGELADAKRAFSASRSACSDACAAPLIGMATAFKLESRFDEAIQTMENAIRENPSDAVNYLYLGDIEIRANQFPNAEKTLLAAIRLDPQSAIARYMYAYALLKESPDDAPRAAIDSLESSIRLDPSSGLARLRLGAILAQRGDYARAETLLADAVRLEPGLKQAHFQYATVLRKLGHPELATKEIAQFQSLTAQHSEEDLEMMKELRRLPPITP